MNKKHLSYAVILMIGILSASCLSGGGTQADNSSGAESQRAEGGTATGDTAYGFSMSAEVDGLVADMAYDQLQSEWVGNFTVNEDGQINGEGVVIYDALIFAVDEELCGYNWAEKGEVKYVISGKVREEGGEIYYPLKFQLQDANRLTLTGPDATCSDPADFLKDMPDQYLIIHRDALLSTVLTHLHQNVGDQIQLGNKLEQTSGTVSYQIKVSLEPIPLD